MNNLDKKIIFDSLQQVIETGLKFNNENCTEEQFNIWIDYTRKMLEITAKGSLSIELNLLQLLLSFHNYPNLTARDKLTMCLDYFIEILKSLTMN